MCCFSRLEHIAHYKAKNQNSQNKFLQTHTHIINRKASRGEIYLISVMISLKQWDLTDWFQGHFGWRGEIWLIDWFQGRFEEEEKKRVALHGLMVITQTLMLHGLMVTTQTLMPAIQIQT